MLHIESKLDFGLDIRVVDLEEAVNELFQVHVAVSVQVKYSEEPLTNDARKLRVLKGYKELKGEGRD